MKALSYRYKTWLLYVLLILLVYLLHKKFFAATVHLVNNTLELENKMASDGLQAFSGEQDLQTELARYAAINVLNTDTVNPANEVLNLISEEDDDLSSVQLIKMDEPLVTEINRYEVNTYPVTLSGDYVSLVAIIDKLERELSLSRISSVRFYGEQKNREEQVKLYAVLSLQYISK